MGIDDGANGLVSIEYTFSVKAPTAPERHGADEARWMRWS